MAGSGLFWIDAPDQIHSTPGETGAESGNHDFVTLLEFMFILVETEGYRCSGSIAIMLDIHEHLLLGDLDTATDSLDDTEVSLMRDEPIEIIDREVVALHHRERRIEHISDGVLVDDTPLLIDVVFTSLDSFVRSGLGRAAGLHTQVVKTGSVDMDFAIDYADGLIGGFDQDGSGAVAEERASGTVLIVDHA